MMAPRAIAFAVVGVGLAGTAGWVGVRSVASTIAPQGAFSLLATLPRAATSSESLPTSKFGGTANVVDTVAASLDRSTQKPVLTQSPQPSKHSYPVILKYNSVSNAGVAVVAISTIVPGAKVSAPVKEVSSVAASAVVEPPALPSVEQCSYVTTQFPNYSRLLINEVAWMGTVADSSNEWIELKNISSEPLSLAGYQLIDKGEQIKVTLPKTTLAPGGFFILERGEDALPTTAGLVYVGALANTNEGLRLFDSHCFLVDQVEASADWPAGDSSQKRSMERGSNLGWHTFAGAAAAGILGTPGQENSLPAVAATTAAATLATEASVVSANPPVTVEASTTTPVAAPPVTTSGHLFISEVLAGTEQSSDYEFVELYNPTGGEIDLTGWAVKKRSSTGNESTLVATSKLAGKKIGVGKHFLLAHDTSYTAGADVFWAKSYDLAYSNNAVVLYDASGAKIDESAWVSLEKGQSWARQGETGSFVVNTAPTPQTGQ